MNTQNPTLIPGFHGVRETLIQGRVSIREIWIATGKKPGRIRDILRIAEEHDIPVFYKEVSKLSRLLPDVAHQGIVAVAEEFSYADLNQVIETSLQDREHAVLIVADHITDEGNLGALIRTAAFFGVHGLIIPGDRSARVSARILKRSSSGYLHLPIAKVVNIGRTLDLLVKRGFWIIGASGEASTSIYSFDWGRDLALVLGNEKSGLSIPARKRCHETVSIPSSGPVESLNVSVSGGIILSEIVRQRG
jgi:23S rRNA (guanosine2251-2'-O)-methyltransferase